MKPAANALSPLSQELRELLTLRAAFVRRFLDVVMDPSSHPERSELIAQVAQLDSVAYEVLWEMAELRGFVSAETPSNGNDPNGQNP